MGDIVCCPLSSGDPWDRPAFSKKTQPTARKPHTCIECRETIAAGQRYERYTTKWDSYGPGPIDTFTTCLSCVEIRNHFACKGGWTFGEVWNDLEQNFFPDMKAGGPCMAGLSPAAKARLFDRRLKWLEDRS